MAEITLRNLYVRPLLLSSTVFSVLALLLVLLNSFINLPKTSLFLGGYAVFAFVASLFVGMLYLDWLWRCQYVQKVDEIKKLRRELEAQRSQAEDFGMSESQIESMGLDSFLTDFAEDISPDSESEVQKKQKRKDNPDPFRVLGFDEE